MDTFKYFFHETLGADQLHLDEETSKHIVGVLRMKEGDKILLTNGKGKKATAVITGDNRKKVTVEVVIKEFENEITPKICVAVSLLKTSARFEWFLEKATEIGVNEIIPIICHRTEKEKFRQERMNNIMISAMLQSQQAWLPLLSAPQLFNDVVHQTTQQLKLIAHCTPGNDKQELAQLLNQNNNAASAIILIGPEGDFTETEIEKAVGNNFLPVALGETRLRTETAALVAATLLKSRF